MIAAELPGYTRSLATVIHNNIAGTHEWNRDWKFVIVRPHHTAANIG
ncbi:hypothetical protein [Baekduia sp. Peel2402]